MQIGEAQTAARLGGGIGKHERKAPPPRSHKTCPQKALGTNKQFHGLAAVGIPRVELNFYWVDRDPYTKDFVQIAKRTDVSHRLYIGDDEDEPNFLGEIQDERGEGIAVFTSDAREAKESPYRFMNRIN